MAVSILVLWWEFSDSALIFNPLKLRIV